MEASEKLAADRSLARIERTGIMKAREDGRHHGKEIRAMDSRLYELRVSMRSLVGAMFREVSMLAVKACKEY